MKAGAGCHLSFDQVKFLVAGLCLLAGAGFFSASAQAANVTIVLKTSERLEYDDNITRSFNSPGSVYGSLSTVSSDFGWQTPRLGITANLKSDFRRFAGPGKTDNLNSFNQNASLGLVKRGLTSQFSLASNFSRQNTAFSELDDTDITNQDTDRLTFSLNSGWTYSVNSRNSLTLSGSATRVDFTKSSTALSPFTNLGAQAQWTHNLSVLTSVNSSLGWSFFKADDLAARKSNTLSLSMGLSTRLSPRLSISAGGGGNLTQTKRNLVALGAIVGRTSDTTLGFQANVAMEYALRNTRLSASLQQSLQPSADGRLNLVSSLGFNISHDINQFSAFTLATSATRRKANGSSSSGSNNQFSVAPTYTYKLARDWNASIGYSFALRTESGLTAKSNKLFVQLSKNTTLDP